MKPRSGRVSETNPKEMEKKKTENKNISNQIIE